MNYRSANRRTAILGSVFAIGAALGIHAPVALAEYCRFSMPDHAADVVGATFEGRVTHIRLVPNYDHATTISIDVGSVYANTDDQALLPHTRLDIHSNGCDGIGFLGIRAGDDLLVSTASLDPGPSTWNSAVWRIQGRRMDLLVLPTSRAFPKVWFTPDHRILSAHSRSDALALVAPGALPPTDRASGALEKAPAGQPVEGGLVVLAWALGLCAIARFRRRIAERSTRCDTR